MTDQSPLHSLRVCLRGSLVLIALLAGPACRSFQASDYASLPPPPADRMAARVRVPREPVLEAFGDLEVEQSEEVVEAERRKARATQDQPEASASVAVDVAETGQAIASPWELDALQGEALGSVELPFPRVGSALSTDVQAQLDQLEAQAALRIPAELGEPGRLEVVPTHWPRFSRNNWWFALSVVTLSVPQVFGAPTASKTVEVGWALRDGACVLAFARGRATTYAAMYWGYSVINAVHYHDQVGRLSLPSPTEHTRSAVAAANQSAWQQLMQMAWEQAEPGRCTEVPPSL